MSENTVLVTILSGALAVVLGTATFFIQKWIALVDETLKEHNSVIYKVSSQVSSFESMQGRQTEDLSEALRAEIRRNSAASIAGLHEIRKEVEIVKDVIQTRVLPHVELTKNQLGKIIIVEKNQEEQGKLITKLYETLKLVIEKSSRPK
jgi:hypothetical protein